MVSSYCVKCGMHTESVNPKKVTTKNGRHAIKSTCKQCGTLKYVFTK